MTKTENTNVHMTGRRAHLSASQEGSRRDSSMPIGANNKNLQFPQIPNHQRSVRRIHSPTTMVKSHLLFFCAVVPFSAVNASLRGSTIPDNNAVVVDNATGKVLPKKQQRFLNNNGVIAPDETAYIACGNPGNRNCMKYDGMNEMVAHKTETHEVRCCSDTSISGWKKNSGCAVWGESDLFGADPGSPKECHHAATYDETEAICFANEARLCTKDELMNGCTKSSGCQHDSDLVWSSAQPEGNLVQMHWTSCGRMGNCGDIGGELLDASDTAYVRCCSNDEIDGWKYFDDEGCGVYSESDRPEINNGQCSGLVSFEQAETICENAGARLCTREECMNNCARGTGCQYDRERIWTSSVGMVEASTVNPPPPTPTPTPGPTLQPTPRLTSKPSSEPTDMPTLSPSAPPSDPTAPNQPPSSSPSTSTSPTKRPSPGPSGSSVPSAGPTSSPSLNGVPSSGPTASPSNSASPSGSTSPTTTPSPGPSGSSAPSILPTASPSASGLPSVEPTSSPSLSIQPTRAPSSSPSRSTSPTKMPSPRPSASLGPSITPTESPTRSPWPSKAPTSSPSNSVNPTQAPSSGPSVSTGPTRLPSAEPTSSSVPSIVPTKSQSLSVSPSTGPTASPSRSVEPTEAQSSSPSASMNPSSAPTPAPSISTIPSAAPADVSDLPNWDFEQDGLTPWYQSGGSLAKSQEHAHSGMYGAVSTGRTAGWNGLAQNVIGIIEPDVPYFVSIWAKLVNPPTQDPQHFFVTIYEERDTGSGTDRRYPKPIYSTNRLTEEWQYFEGTYRLTNPQNLTALRFFPEGPGAGYSFAVDDVVLTKVVTSSPSDAPSGAPTITPVPTGTPSLAPSGSPSWSPSPEPTVLDYFVSATSNTERVIIPQPPTPILPPRSGCPQDDASLTDWTTLFPALTVGQDVQLPDNTKVIISSTVTTQLGLVTIPASSELIFAENAAGISFDVSGIKVEGTLTAGSETCRYETELTITLHGSRPAGITDRQNSQDPSYKGISVTGRIDLHGKRFYRTWTRLAQRALEGNNFLYLQDDVNWETGQEIVLVTTATRDSRDWHQNEVFTVANVRKTLLPDPAVAAVVELTSAIQYDHIARPEYQGEVGLLTRTIKVQGASDDSPPTDITDATCQLLDHNGDSKTAFGYNSVTCPDKYLTGYGGHIMVHSGGIGYVEGVELYRMGQTNVLGRYPMHFHLLGNDCPGCYLKDSSIHESYYRCISVHATNGVTVTENVAFDVSGYCYYLEDGVEEGNALAYNLAAHVHVIGMPAKGAAQLINPIDESLSLTLPADVTASGFYITNLNNTIIGNSASGGWAGFAFPILQEPVGPSRVNHAGYDPSLQPSHLIDGNTAHSTAHFWNSAAAFYFGGSLYYLEDGTQQYNAGRDQDKGARRNSHWNRITNSKAFQIANVGLGSWSGRMEVVGYEIHDFGLAAEALVAGFWMDNMVADCRTGELLALPVQRADYIAGNGFFWYDTGQEHIITDSTFRHCGYRSDEYDQYDTSPSRGCGKHIKNGCGSGSTVFGLLTHSDQFNPEIMQATKNITLDSVGRRFKFTRNDIESVSGRLQNWYDVDGSVSGLEEPTLMGSGHPTAGKWWKIDDDVELDEQAPLVFIQEGNGPHRGLAHIRLDWDADLHATTGETACLNGGSGLGISNACPGVGHIRHRGSRFNLVHDPEGGLPVTANSDIAGLAGGYGWVLDLDEGAPVELDISQMEISPDTPLLFSVAYPIGTTFEIKALANQWCSPSTSNGRECEELFERVDTVDAVYHSAGNLYHFDDSTGLLTIRVAPVPSRATSYNGDWRLYDWDDVDPITGTYILPRFERGGVRLPMRPGGSVKILADCATSDGIYCSGSTLPVSTFDDVCSSALFEQVAYDKCCEIGNPTNCEPMYPITPSPTTSPSAAPTATPCPVRTTNLFPNEGFENSRNGEFCEWLGINADIAFETSDAYQGSQSVLVSNRGARWGGLWIRVTDQFQFDVTYRFQAAIKILNGNAVNSMGVTMKFHFTDGGSNAYKGVWSNNNIPNNTWITADTTFTLAPSSIRQDSAVTRIEIYFQSSDNTNFFDYLVDDASMDPESMIV